MGYFGHHKGHMEHHAECGHPMCAERRECKKKMLMAMVFFGMIAVANLFIVGMIHLMLHAKESFHGH